MYYNYYTEDSFIDLFPAKDDYPKVNLKTDNDDNTIIELEVPGFDKNQLKVKLDESYLIIEGKKENDNKDEKLSTEVNQFTHFSFHRKFLLNVYKINNIKASLNNGILSIILMNVKHKRDNIREIEIN